MAEEDKASGLVQAYRQAGPYLGLGVELAASILLCLFLGRWLDGKLGTGPALMLAGTLLGAVAGFVNFYRAVLKLQEKTDRNRPEAGRES